MGRIAAVAALSFVLGRNVAQPVSGHLRIEPSSFTEAQARKVASGRCRGPILPQAPGKVPGTVSARASGISTVEDCMNTACTPYPSCNYVSFSLQADVCSTYSHCDIENLDDVRVLNYSTLAVDPSSYRPKPFAINTQVSRVVDEFGAWWGACRLPNPYFAMTAADSKQSNTTNSTTTPEGVEVTYSTVFTEVKADRTGTRVVPDPLGTIPGTIFATDYGIRGAMDCMRTACRPFANCSYVSYNAIGGECLTHRSCDNESMVHVNRLGQDFVTLHRGSTLRCDCRNDDGKVVGIGCGGPSEFPCPWTLTECSSPGRGYCMKCFRSLGYAEQARSDGGCDKLVQMPQYKAHDMRAIVDRSEKSMTAALHRIRARAHEAMQALEDAKNGKTPEDGQKGKVP